MFNEAGQCLMLRRSAANRNFAGCWEWPGGKVDPGENFAVALMREVREEAGLDVEIIGFAGATSFEMPEVHVVLLCMEARMKGGEVRLSEEHDAFEWVPLADGQAPPRRDRRRVHGRICQGASRAVGFRSSLRHRLARPEGKPQWYTGTSAQVVVALLSPHAVRKSSDPDSPDSLDSVCLDEISFEPVAQISTTLQSPTNEHAA